MGRLISQVMKKCDIPYRDCIFKINACKEPLVRYKFKDHLLSKMMKLSKIESISC